MTVDRERECPRVPMNDCCWTTEVVDGVGVNVVLRIEPLLARFVRVSCRTRRRSLTCVRDERTREKRTRRQDGSLETNLADLCTAPDIPRSWGTFRVAGGMYNLLTFTDEGPLVTTFGITRVKSSKTPLK